MIMIKKQILFLSMIIFLSSFVYGVLSDGLVGYYPFDTPIPRQNNSINTSFNWDDYAINFTGNTSDACIEGGCVWGEGANNDRLEDAGFPVMTDYTISFFIYYNRSGVQDEVPIDLEDNNWLILYKDSNGTQRFIEHNSGGAGCTQLAFNVVQDTWYQIIIARNNTHYKIYLNGSALTYAGSPYIACGGVYNKGRSDTLFNEDQIGGFRYDFQGMLDDFVVWNRVLSESEISQINQTTYLVATTPTPDTTPPNISMIYPLNTTFYDNYNGSIVLSLDEVGGNCSIDPPVTDWDYLSDNTTTFNFNRTGTPEANHSITVSCWDVALNNATINFWFVVDETNPVITLNTPVNNSIHNANFTLSVDYSDLYLWKTNTTIKNASNVVFYNNYSGLLGGATTTYNISDIIDVANMTDGTYTIYMEATDTHTINEFKENLIYNDICGFDECTKMMELDDLNFNMYYPTDIYLKTVRSYDRYNFIFENKVVKSDIGEIVVRIESYNKPIYYLEDSPFNCHFILNDEYWLDFMPLECTVKKINNNVYDVTLNIRSDKVVTDSLGGLNDVSTIAYFIIDKTAPYMTYNETYNTSSSIGVYLTVSENVTLNYTIGSNCTHALYNGSLGLNDTFNFTRTGLTSNTTYFINMTLNDSLNTANYCINSTTTPVSTTTTTTTTLSNTEKAFFLFAGSFLFVIMLGIGLYLQNYYIMFFGALYGLMFGLWIYQNLPIFPELLGLSVMIFSVYVGLASLFSKKVTV